MFLVRQIIYLVAFSDDFQTSKGIGNDKPPLLVEVENQLLSLLFRLACLETDLTTGVQGFSSWLEGKWPELMNEAPDSRAWFKSDPSCQSSKTTSNSMHLQSMASPVFALEPRWRIVGNDVDGRVDDNREDDNREDEDRVNKVGEDEDGVDKDGEDEDRMDEDRMDKDSMEIIRLETDDMDIDETPEGEGVSLLKADGAAAEEITGMVNDEGGNSTMVRAMSDPAGERNGGEDHDMEGGTIATKDVEENDGAEDGMKGREHGSGNIVEENDGAEDGMKGREHGSGKIVEENGKEGYESDALSSLPGDDDDDDDGGRGGNAEKGKKPAKEEKPPVKKPSKKESKDWNRGMAGLRKETAIDVDAFFVSCLLGWLLTGSLIPLY
jgi:hypothetical protein